MAETKGRIYIKLSGPDYCVDHISEIYNDDVSAAVIHSLAAVIQMNRVSGGVSRLAMLANVLVEVVGLCSSDKRTTLEDGLVNAAIRVKDALKKKEKL